jgi:hypothetical protein
MNLLCLAYRCASWWCHFGTMDRNAQCVSHLINNVDCNPTLGCQISDFFSQKSKYSRSTTPSAYYHSEPVNSCLNLHVCS